MSYEDFLAGKRRSIGDSGFNVDLSDSPHLFPFQRDLVRWALLRGRAAIFAMTGLGKTRMELTWAQKIREHAIAAGQADASVLGLVPLSVAVQTQREGAAIGVPVTVAREAADLRPGINVTNYDRLHKFDVSRFAGVFFDESSVIKHHDSKTFANLLAAARDVRYRLCATATPAPNDFAELGTHAELLGACSRAEMLAEYFVHDSGETQVWRLKGHARAEFWRWVASWGAMVRKPSDLGYADDGYDLPPLTVLKRILGDESAPVASTLTERRAARKASMGDRVAECVADVRREPGEQWVVWCELNAEQDALAAALGKECVSIYGSLDADRKELLHDHWLAGGARVLISKPSIFGFGLNWQHCARMSFVGVSDSFESYFQAVRRCWRFKQEREVVVRLYASAAERAVLENLERKEADAVAMGEALAAETRGAVKDEVRGLAEKRNPYEPKERLTLPAWARRSA